MVSHSSATAREHTPHASQPTRTATIINALKRRAQAVLNDESIDFQSRAIIRYGLETNDPWLAELVRRADAGESVADAFDDFQTSDMNEHVSSEHEPNGNASGPEPSYKDSSEENTDDSPEETIEALANIICRGGAEGTTSAALLILMAKIENATYPRALANLVKHFAFTRCGELNLGHMIEAQLFVLEGELLAANTVRV